MLDNWQRIEQVIKWAGAASVSAFARELGLNRSENLYQIKRGNNGIRKDLADTIVSKYPLVSKAWLITGEGEMLQDKAAKEKYDIPFYKSDAEEFVATLATIADGKRFGEEAGQWPEPSYYISFPMLRGCHFAAFTFSDAMQPEIPRGTTLFFERVTPETVIPGGVFLVVSAVFNGIRQLRREPGRRKVRLVPKNREDYDEVEIELSDIDSIFQVKAILQNK